MVQQGPHQAPGPVEREEDEVDDDDEVGERAAVAQRGGVGGVAQDVARAAVLRAVGGAY